MSEQEGGSNIPNSGPGLNPPELCSRFADATVFLGMTSVPLAEEAQFLGEMRRFFRTYQQRVEENLPEAQRAEFRRYYYRPAPYMMLAHFDLALLALVDDWEFAVRNFNAFDPMWPRVTTDARNRAFAHRSFVGPCPWWPGDQGTHAHGRALHAAVKNTFLKDKPAPLLGIVQVEVNDSLLVGGGANFLRCVEKAIESCFCEQFGEPDLPERHPGTDLIILESYSWHELTLLVFSNSFAEIDRFILKIREMSLLDMGHHLCRVGRKRTAPESYRAEWQEFIETGDVFGLDPRLHSAKPLRSAPVRKARLSTQAEAFLHDVNRQDGLLFRELLDRPPFGTHPIYNTTTSMAFSAELLEAVLGEASPRQQQASLRAAMRGAGIDEQDHMFLMRHWSAKSGHLRAALEALASGRADARTLGHNYLTTSGRGDFYYPCRVRRAGGGEARFERMSSRQVVECAIMSRVRVNRWRLKHKQDWERSGGILGVHSTIAFHPSRGHPRIGDGHVSAKRIRRQFVVDLDRIERLFRGAIGRLWISKVNAEAVTNAIALYNEGIMDKLLFSSFLELQPYVERIIRYLEARSQQTTPVSADEVAQSLEVMVENFVTGWRNRSHAGWHMGDVSDFNLEFKGGIQQLVSAFHGVVRLVRWYFTGNERALAVVGGRPGISYQAGAVRLNQFDVFQPEFFAARVGHEVSEGLIELVKANPARFARLFGDAGLGVQFTTFLELTTFADIDEDASARKSAALEPYIAGPRWQLALRDQDAIRPLLPSGKWRSVFFDQVYADYCNFNSVFLGDRDLYSYWFLASFVVDPVNWNTDHRVDPTRLNEALLRMFLVFRAPRLDGSAPGSGKNARSCVERYWTELSSARYARRGAVRGMYRLAGRLARPGSPIDKWLRAVSEVAGGLDRALHPRRRQEAQYLRERLLLNPFAPEVRRDLRKARHCAMMAKVGLAGLSDAFFQTGYVSYCGKATLREGKSVSAGGHRRLLEALVEPFPYALDRWFDFSDTIGLLHAYLALLKKEGIGSKSKAKRMILDRDFDSGAVRKAELKRAGCARLLFDPRGGSFTHDAMFRRNYLQWRCALTASLWDCSERAKLSQAGEILRRRAQSD